jgi:hydroxymethylpyrimidine/phosphomethylpyrimidine kinase
MNKGRVLIVAGSDSGGGAGIQADIKTVTALGGYAMTAITAITVQNTLGVFGVHGVSAGVVQDQIRAVMDDIGADAIKIGMLGEAAMAEAVADALAAYRVPIVLDPVMIAKGGAPLLRDDAIGALKARLVPRAALVTPNAPEAERLTGVRVQGVEDQIKAGEKLRAQGAEAALIKGGHIEGETIRDVLVTGAGVHVYEGERIATRATHGTGCTLASAIAVSLAQGVALEYAVERARAYLREAILHAPGFGAGHGPVDHGWPLRGKA